MSSSKRGREFCMAVCAMNVVVDAGLVASGGGSSRRTVYKGDSGKNSPRVSAT